MSDTTPVESMAACIVSAYLDVTWTKALGHVRSHPIWIRVAQAALDHLPYLEREKLNAMLDAEIGS